MLALSTQRHKFTFKLSKTEVNAFPSRRKWVRSTKMSRLKKCRKSISGQTIFTFLPLPLPSSLHSMTMLTNSVEKSGVRSAYIVTDPWLSERISALTRTIRTEKNRAKKLKRVETKNEMQWTLGFFSVREHLREMTSEVKQGERKILRRYARLSRKFPRFKTYSMDSSPLV